MVSRTHYGCHPESATRRRSAASARTLATGAREEADSFERDIVSAKHQAADAQSHLADALERTARLEQQLSWRTVSPEQKTALRKLHFSYRLLLPLRNLTIQIAYVNQNPEAEEYAAELKDCLDGLGAEISEPTGAEFFGTKTLQGVIITANHFPEAVVLLHALNKAGILAVGQANKNMNEHTVGITVGSKPRN